MPLNLTNANEFISKKVKHTVDDIVFKLESTGQFAFSEGTALEMATLTLDFITRFSELAINQNLVEPEKFEQNARTRIF